MLMILLVLVLALALGGAGFVLHVLWYVAIAVFVLWLLGFLVRSTGGGGHWYRW